MYGFFFSCKGEIISVKKFQMAKCPIIRVFYNDIKNKKTSCRNELLMLKSRKCHTHFNLFAFPIGLKLIEERSSENDRYVHNTLFYFIQRY